jgi:hypothetical protein
MKFTPEQLDILLSAWAQAARGRGLVLKDHAIPVAHQLAEAGWLERRFEPDGELSWHWTRQGENALAYAGVVDDAKERKN